MLSECETSSLDELTEQSWIWIVDMQKICSLVIGYSLGGLVLGKPFSKNEISCSQWLSNEIFSSGIEHEDMEMETLSEISYLAISGSPELVLARIDKLPAHIQNLCRLALPLRSQFDEACAVSEKHLFASNIFFEKFMDIAEVESWELEDEKNILDTVMCCLLTTILKHTGLLKKLPTEPAVKEIFNLAISFRNQLISKINNRDECCTDDKDTLYDTLNEPFNSIKEHNFKYSMQEIIDRCLFLLLVVKGKITYYLSINKKLIIPEYYFK